MFTKQFQYFSLGLFLAIAIGAAPLFAADNVACENLKQALGVTVFHGSDQVISIRQAQDFDVPVDVVVNNIDALSVWNGFVTLQFSFDNDIPGSVGMTRSIQLQRLGEAMVPPSSLAFKSGPAMMGDYKLSVAMEAYGSPTDSQHRLCSFDFAVPVVMARVQNNSQIADIDPPQVTNVSMDAASYRITDHATVTLSVSEAGKLCRFESLCPDTLSLWIAFVDANGDRTRKYRLQSLEGTVVGQAINRELKYEINLARVTPPLLAGTYAIYFFPLTDEYGNFSSTIPSAAQAQFTIENGI